MAKSNSVSTGVIVTAGNVVHLRGERISHSKDGVIFRHKRPRSSKMLRSIVPLSAVISSSPDAICFHGDPAKYGITSYEGDLTNLVHIADNVFEGTDGDGNAVLVNGNNAQFISEDEDSSAKKADKKSSKKSSKKKKED